MSFCLHTHFQSVENTSLNSLPESNISILLRPNDALEIDSHLLLKSPYERAIEFNILHRVEVFSTSVHRKLVVHTFQIELSVSTNQT